MGFMNEFDQGLKSGILGTVDAEADPELAVDDTDTDPGMILIIPETPSPCFVIVIGDCIFPSVDLKIMFPLLSVLTIDESMGG